MTALFVALGIMVLALLALLLWFVPRLLQQQAVRVSDESAQLREMLLDLLSEQEAVTIRQTQLGAAIAQLQARFDVVAPTGNDTIGMIDRVNQLQQTLQTWAEQRDVAHASSLDGNAMQVTINEIVTRLDAMQIQMRDTATLVDDGVLFGVRQLGEQVHAIQLQLETWVETASQHHGDEADVLRQVYDQLAVVRARLDQAREANPLLDAPIVTPSESLTTQLPDQ